MVSPLICHSDPNVTKMLATAAAYEGREPVAVFGS
jgi:hypothetical protein